MKITKTKTGTYQVCVDMGRTLDGKRDQKQVTHKTMRNARREQTRLEARRGATQGSQAG